MASFFEDETFEDIKTPLEKGNYEYCTFINCDLNKVDLSHINFIDCEFTSCNLSNCPVGNTSFKNVRFDQCKLLGIDFFNANAFLFQVHVNESSLDFSSFYDMDLRKSSFDNCSLNTVDFTNANLEKIALTNCNLVHALFDKTNLSRANLSGSTNFVIDPSINNISEAIFDRESLLGLLTKHNLTIND